MSTSAAPDVSVIIPVFNTEDYLRDCLDSLQSQTLAHFEVLCVNDGSTDGSVRILNEYAARDPRIRILSQPDGQSGPGAARNLAFREARADFVAFVDSDDYVDPTFLHELYRAAREADADIAMCTIAKFSAMGETGERYAACTYDRYLPAAFDSQPFNWKDMENPFSLRFVVWNKIYRREFLNSHDIRFSEGIFFEDMIFTYRALFLADRMRLVRRPLYYNRRQRRGSTTYEQSDRIIGSLTAFKQVDEFLASEPELNDMRERFAAFRFVKMTEYLHKNDAVNMPRFFEALKDFAQNPSLDGNPYLLERHQQRRQVLAQSDLIGYLAWEIWLTKTQYAKVRRQRSRLRSENQELRQRVAALRRSARYRPGRIIRALTSRLGR